LAIQEITIFAIRDWLHLRQPAQALGPSTRPSLRQIIARMRSKKRSHKVQTLLAIGWQGNGKRRCG
jgi:hypothetical protein